MMGTEFHFRDKIKVAILGATGSVGQRFVEILSHHPWFEIVALAASERSIGKTYAEAVNWLLSKPIPEKIASLVVTNCTPCIDANLIFSALDADVATEIERDFAKAGYTVISNAKNHRLIDSIPLIVPEINSSHLELMQHQSFKGKIVTNPNCSTVALTMALKPLQDLWGIDSVHVVTMQSVSGAGYPGVSSMDILDNVIPFIPEEESKIETETLKILGTFQQTHVIPAHLKISAQCNRIPVREGHTECLSVKLKTKPEKSEIIRAWREFKGDVQNFDLPSAPQSPIYYFEELFYPQPKLHRNLDKGMAISIGQLQECPVFDYKFTLLSHNTIRGAAGGAILTAELLVRKGFIFW